MFRPFVPRTIRPIASEAQFVTVQVALLSECRLRKQQRRRYGRLHDLWKHYDDRET